jgi:AraC family ethanolamine operon transcriptional activator
MKTKIFHDFDAFAESVRDVDSKMMLRNPKRRLWSTTAIDLGEINIQVGRLGSGNIAEGELRTDGYMLYLPLSDGVEYSANGNVLDKGSFAVLEPGCEFCISTKVEHDWCAVFIPNPMFASVGEIVEPSLDSRTATCRVTRPHLQATRQFRDAVGQIITAAANHSQFESTGAASCAAAELFSVAALFVGQRQAGEPIPQGRPRLPREEVIRRSKKLLKKREGERILVADLAAAAEVSERTLRTAFNEYYGVAPVRYLQMRQLHRVRRTLREAHPEAVTVSDVLVAHGEWEFSRFASRYRRLFGELPSETLRR